MSHTNHYFIIAGEPSADNHGASLMKEMKILNPNIQFHGIGGSKMEIEGLESLVPIKKMSVMGFVEVLKHLQFFKRIEKEVIQSIKSIRPTRVILIDYPGFNLRIAKKLHKTGIPVTYFIAPQVWAWKEKRLEIIRKYIDQLLVIFPFEKAWFKNKGVNAHFVGHPIMDEWNPSSKTELRNTLGLDADKPLLTLFPGSRMQEIDRHLHLFTEAGKILKEQIPQLQIALGLAPGFDKDVLVNKYNLNGIHIIQGKSHQILESADCAIIASGTSTLEGAVFGVPMVVVYKMASLSWVVSKKLVRVPFAGMVNLIAGREIVPECLQDEATPTNIANKILPFFNDVSVLETAKMELQKVRESLGGRGASKRAAKLILEASS